MTTPARVVEHVCVVRELHEAPGTVGRTAIDKAPVEGPVHVRDLGLRGDVQADRVHHGGPDKAVYAYSAGELAHWSGVLGAPLPPGIFGENLLVAGPPVDDALVGERWRVGEALELEVTGPRRPCRVFADWVERDGWVREFFERGRPGVYLRVVTPGPVTAGDAVEVLSRPSHGVSVAEFFLGPAPDAARRVLDAEDAGELRLADKERARFATAASRGSYDLTPGA